MNVHTMFRVSSYIIYVLADFRDTVPLRYLKNLNKITKNLRILPAENNVLFKFNFLRLYKVDFKNSKAYE